MNALTINTISVLLIEPSSTQRKIIEEFLSQIGVNNIDRADHGDEALSMMRQSAPDLVISSLYLPDLSGTDLVKMMRMDTNLQDVPFILISSETRFRYLDPIRQAGTIAILPKPFKLAQLRQALTATLQYLQPGEIETRAFSSEELNVLLVDDSLTARRHIARVLINMGVEKLTEAENGVEALELIKDNFYDLIITDYNMPEMDGKELVEHIRSGSAQASVPILMVSSESNSSRLSAVQNAGVSAICDKPFDAATVKELIEGMLG